LGIKGYDVCEYQFIPEIARDIGFVLIAWGLLRESFHELADRHTFGRDRLGDLNFGEVPTIVDRCIIPFAKFIRLLPKDGLLTPLERKKNAALSITGVIISVLTMLFTLFAEIFVFCGN
jgi:hypothetical protein